MTGDDPLDADPLKPPDGRTSVSCLRCGSMFDSDRIVYRVDHDADGVLKGLWCCPVANCTGYGYGHDLIPIEDEDDSDDEFDAVDDEDSWMDDEDADDEPDDTPLDPPGGPDDDIPF